jgi:hypothetical protein
VQGAPSSGYKKFVVSGCKSEQECRQKVRQIGYQFVYSKKVKTPLWKSALLIAIQAQGV